MNKADDTTAYFTITDSADVSAAVVGTSRLPLLREGSETDRAMIATIVSELGSNIVKYAKRGVLRVCRTQDKETVDIEIWAEDNGPGIADVALAMQDHFSTGNSLGLGLPGVRRMADEFWIRSSEHAGTRVFARKRLCGKAPRDRATTSPRSSRVSTPAPVEGPDTRWDAGAWVRPIDANTACGDAAVVQNCDGGVLLAIVDGAGHGQRAHDVAQRVLAIITDHASPDLDRLMARIHDGLRGTVGAAVGLAFVDTAASMFRYLAVGNTRATKFGREAWHGVSRDGLLGDRLPSSLEQSCPLVAGDMLLMWTDGIPESTSTSTLSASSYRGASDIARQLVKQLGKPYDDAGCVVFKWQA